MDKEYIAVTSLFFVMLTRKFIKSHKQKDHKMLACSQLKPPIIMHEMKNPNCPFVCTDFLTNLYALMEFVQDISGIIKSKGTWKCSLPATKHTGKLMIRCVRYVVVGSLITMSTWKVEFLSDWKIRTCHSVWLYRGRIKVYWFLSLKDDRTLK